MPVGPLTTSGKDHSFGVRPSTGGPRDGYSPGMPEWIFVTDKMPPSNQSLYVNVDAIDCVWEDGADTYLRLRSGREVRAGSDLHALSPKLGLHR